MQDSKPPCRLLPRRGLVQGGDGGGVEIDNLEIEIGVARLSPLDDVVRGGTAFGQAGAPSQGHGAVDQRQSDPLPSWWAGRHVKHPPG